MTLSETQLQVVTDLRSGNYGTLVGQEDGYSRLDVRVLVEAYPSLCESKIAGEEDEGGGQQIREWDLEQQVVAHADLTAAFEALRRWELRWGVGINRSVSLVWRLMEERDARTMERLMGCKNGESRVYVEEGLEFIYQFLDGRAPATDRIRLPKYDAYHLADLWADLRGDQAA